MAIVTTPYVRATPPGDESPQLYLHTELGKIQAALSSVTQTLALLTGNGVSYSEQVTVSAPDTLAPLTHAPSSGSLLLLIVNSAVYTAAGASPAFTASGTTLTWSSANAGFSLATTDVVLAVYNY